MTLSQYKVYLVLFVLVISSWLLADLFEEKKAKQVKTVDHSPEFFSSEYYKKEMDDQGQVKNELVADTMIHYSDDGTTHLDNPLMTLHNPSVPPWIIKSEKGIVEADRDHLLLKGKVRISRMGTRKTRSFKMNTSELRVKLSTSYAKTNHWAEIIDVAAKTEGVGLEITFVEPIRLKFMSKVKGRYEVN